jgi:PEP-CTERM motif
LNSKTLLQATALAAALVWSGQAMALPSNVDEPTGPVLLDLNGTPLPQGYQQYSVSFTAVTGTTSTDLGFAFRDDPGFLTLDNVTLTANSGPATNLVVNGDFETGVPSSTPVGWSFQNPNGALAQGVVIPGDGVGGSNGWVDGAVQAYDTLFQNIATVGGAGYTLSFDLTQEGATTANFQRLSTNGDDTDVNGNGINVVVYAGQGDPVLSTTSGGVPEPASWALMISGFGLAGAALRRRNLSFAA